MTASPSYAPRASGQRDQQQGARSSEAPCSPWSYGEESDAPGHDFLLPAVERLLEPRSGLRVLDVGCGRGQVAGWLLEKGCAVVGIDPSRSGVALARRDFPRARFEVLAAQGDLLAELGERPFDAVTIIEVIEHVYDPREVIATCCRCLAPGGLLVCTTPYHGYLKNLAIALLGGFDKHVNPLSHGGHIKFWSRSTLSQLLASAGFADLRFAGAGRAPFLWKSMVVAGSLA
jgi:2-polyprenyl-6-hydroxyphenyl methylase/3-demethylubiquinone-9 3-methyltransferase